MLHLWKSYTAAPHRVMFLGGMVQILATVAWWSVELVARHRGVQGLWPMIIYSTWAHAWLMLLGLFPFFMFGFLMTTYPRWMSAPSVPQRDYLGAFLFLFAGVALFYAGLYADTRLLATALLLHIIGFGWAILALGSVWRAAEPNRQRRYESHLLVALSFGFIADSAFMAWVVVGDARLLPAAMTAVLWLFLVPVLVLVAHRMIPFFSSSALPAYSMVQPGWSFPLLWCAVALHFVLEIAGARGWLWLSDGPLFFLSWHHSLHWQFRRALGVPLLGALHIAFGFLSLGLMLSMVQSGWLLWTGELILMRAPLHAIGIGFIGGMTVAMATRVSRGHAGLPVKLGRLDVVAFGAVVLAALLRIAAEFAPMAAGSPLPLSLVAALVWMIGILPWAGRYVPVYLQPRADGQPG